MMDEPSYEPFRDGFAAAWEQLRADTAKIRLPSECAACDSKDVCRSCAAMMYTETGSYDRKPEYRCELMRATPAACRRVLKEEQDEQRT